MFVMWDESKLLRLILVRLVHCANILHASLTFEVSKMRISSSFNPDKNANM